MVIIKCALFLCILSVQWLYCQRIYYLGKLIILTYIIITYTEVVPPRPPLPGGDIPPPRPPPPETDDEDEMFMHAPQPNQPIMVYSIYVLILYSQKCKIDVSF